jgi:hypothetical protein
MPIYALKDCLQKFINDSYTGIVQHNEKDGKKDIAEKLKKVFSTRPPLKFALQKEPGGSHVIVLNSPVEIRGFQIWLCNFFGLECKNAPPFYAFKTNTNYTSRNIHDMKYPLSMIEWHCNIVEYSYANHDDHPHLHKQELLHISFNNKHFHENLVHKETPKKNMFISLREGLREIKEIVLTPLNKNGEEIKNLKNATVYLQLKEEY